MAVYKINQISKTLDKLFASGYKEYSQIRKLTWENLGDNIPNLTTFEKGLILDFKSAIRSNKKLLQFLAGIETNEKGEEERED